MAFPLSAEGVTVVLPDGCLAPLAALLVLSASPDDAREQADKLVTAALDKAKAMATKGEYREAAKLIATFHRKAVVTVIPHRHIVSGETRMMHDDVLHEE